MAEGSGGGSGSGSGRLKRRMPGGRAAPFPPRRTPRLRKGAACEMARGMGCGRTQRGSAGTPNHGTQRRPPIGGTMGALVVNLPPPLPGRCGLRRRLHGLRPRSAGFTRGYSPAPLRGEEHAAGRGRAGRWIHNSRIGEDAELRHPAGPRHPSDDGGPWSSTADAVRARRRQWRGQGSAAPPAPRHSVAVDHPRQAPPHRDRRRAADLGGTGSSPRCHPADAPPRRMLG